MIFKYSSSCTDKRRGYLGFVQNDPGHSYHFEKYRPVQSSGDRKSNCDFHDVFDPQVGRTNNIPFSFTRQCLVFCTKHDYLHNVHAKRRTYLRAPNYPRLPEPRCHGVTRV